MFRSAAVFLISIIVVLAVFYLTERTFSPVFQGCVQKHEQTDAGAPSKNYVAASIAAINTNVRCSGEFVDVNSNAITALATIIIAAFTATLWSATTRQAKLTKEALVADKRAFISFKGIFGYWEKDEAMQQYNWRFRATMENTGETPTVHLTIHTACELRNTQLPADFQFVDNSPVGTGLLGPKASSQGGIAPMPPAAALTPQDLHDVQLGRKFLYLWGWARYNDVFPGTERHLTRFAWAVMVAGDPFNYDPQTPAANTLGFSNLYLPTGNCADDECRVQGLG